MGGRNIGGPEPALEATGDTLGPASRLDPLAWALALLGIIVAVYTTWWLSGLGDAALSGRYSGAAAIPAAVLIPILTVRLWRTRRLDRMTRRAWSIIAVGLVGYSFGAGIHYFFGSEPAWNVAWIVGQVLELATYPLVALALAMLPKTSRTIYDTVLFSLDVAIVAWSGAILIWHLVIYPIAHDAGQGLAASVLASVSPVLDLALIFSVAAIVLRGVRESTRASLSVTLSALVLIFLGDLISETETLRGSYVNGGASGAMYSIAWFGLALAAYLQWRVRDSGRPTRGLADYSRSVPWLPYVAMALAFVVPTILDWNDLDKLRLHVPALGLLVALILARLAVTSRQNASLAAAERERLAAAIDQAAEAILTTDRAGHLTYVNQAFSRMTGYRVADILGRDPSLLREHLETKPLDEMTAALIRGDSWAGRVLLKRGDGTSIDVDMTVAPLRDGAGSITGSVAVARDVSRERALEIQLAQSQRLEAVGRLAGGVAHDFNNILTAISGFAELAAAALPEDHPVAPDIAQVLKASDRAAALTRGLLAFSRRQVMQATLVSLNDVVDGLAPMLGRLIGEDIELEILLAPDLGLTMADRAQLEQVIVNLVVNARDAMPAGGKLMMATRNVEVGEAQLRSHPEAVGGSYVSLTVSDTGVGMTPEVLEHAFEPFFTTKERGKGSGMGLSTAVGIVAQSGGFVDVDSRPNLGSVFTVTLPRSYGDSTTERADVPAERAAGGVETVLVVEDEDAVREFAERVLSGAGYRVFTAANGPAGLSQANQLAQLDILFTDVVMPGMSGAELAAALSETRPGLPVVYASGYAEEGDIREALDDDHVPYLPKPYTSEALLALVRETLDRGREPEPEPGPEPV